MVGDRQTATVVPWEKNAKGKGGTDKGAADKGGKGAADKGGKGAADKGASASKASRL